MTPKKSTRKWVWLSVSRESLNQSHPWKIRSSSLLISSGMTKHIGLWRIKSLNNEKVNWIRWFHAAKVKPQELYVGIVKRQINKPYKYFFCAKMPVLTGHIFAKWNLSKFYYDNFKNKLFSLYRSITKTIQMKYVVELVLFRRYTKSCMYEGKTIFSPFFPSSLFTFLIFSSCFDKWNIGLWDTVSHLMKSIFNRTTIETSCFAAVYQIISWPGVL